MSERTRTHVTDFWHLVDEILNAALFLLIGIEILAIPFDRVPIEIVALTIPLVLFARTAAVGLPMLVLHKGRTFTRGTLPILVWGGLRGGISVALALSLPESEYKPLILAATYTVVIFSIVVQGLSMGPVIRRFGPQAVEEEAEQDRLEAGEQAAARHWSHPIAPCLGRVSRSRGWGSGASPKRGR